jgi:hypothetical protein
MYNNFGKTKLLTLISEVSKENQVYQSMADTKKF